MSETNSVTSIPGQDGTCASAGPLAKGCGREGLIRLAWIQHHHQNDLRTEVDSLTTTHLEENRHA